MQFSMTEQENGDLLIQVTAWTGLTVYDHFYSMSYPMTPLIDMSLLLTKEI
jgi:hypothetical protein